MRCAFDGCKKN